MSRTKAAFIHLLLSILVFCALFIAIGGTRAEDFFSPYFIVSGEWEGLKVAAAINFTLGPLLTLTIFNTQKPRKKILDDLAIILALQLAILWWSSITIYGQRPVAIVFWGNSFYTVPATALSNQNFDADYFEPLGTNALPLIYAQKPKTVAGLKRVSKRSEIDRVPPHHQVDLYKPLQNHFFELTTLQVDIEEIIKINTKMKAALMSLLKKKNKKIKNYLYFPLQSRYGNMILVFSPQGEIEGQITVTPRDT